MSKQEWAEQCEACGITGASRKIVSYAFFNVCEPCLEITKFILHDPKYQHNIPRALDYVKNIRQWEKGAKLYAKSRQQCIECEYTDDGRQFCYTAQGPVCYPCRSKT